MFFNPRVSVGFRPWIRLCRSDTGANGVNWCDCSVMYGQWNETGDGLFAVRSRSSPIYYDVSLRCYYLTL